MAIESSSGSSLIVASVVVGLAIVAGSFMIQRSVNQGSERLGAVLAEMQEVGAKVAGAPAAPARAPARPGRPDPAKVYNVALGSAPVKGPKTAKITIVEWSDFQCPFCGRVGPTLEQVKKEYGDQVQLAFKHMPLPMHSKAPAAHAAAEAAAMQGKFWEMHDLLFANQRSVSDAKYVEWAKEIGLDLPKFETDRKSKKVEQRIAADKSQGSKLGVTGTPAFFVNGRFLSGAQPFASFKKLIDEELAKN